MEGVWEAQILFSDNLLICCTAKIQEEHPLLTLEIQDRKFEGLFDSGAEISVIPLKYCSDKWALQDISYSLENIGSVLRSESVHQGSKFFKCVVSENQQTTFLPYVASVSCNLRRCDLYKQ